MKDMNLYYPCFDKSYLTKIDDQLRFINPLISDDFLECFINRQKSDLL